MGQVVLWSLRILHQGWDRVTRPGVPARPSYIGRVSSPERPSLAELREEYAMGGLDVGHADPDPVEMLRRWLYDAVDAGLHEPTAMVLSTVDPDGAPSSRMVLCKGLEKRGLVFYTNYESRKGRALAHDPRVALLFPWHPLQ